MPEQKDVAVRSNRVLLAIGLILLTAAIAVGVYSAVISPGLEEPPSSIKTPNPSKAPWYMLGPQEWLVYYDPWLAGVLPPLLVIAALVLGPIVVALTIFFVRRTSRGVKGDQH